MSVLMSQHKTAGVSTTVPQYHLRKTAKLPKDSMLAMSFLVRI
jgi:hypothetical protein